MPKHGTTKPQTVNYHRVSRNLWRKGKRHLPHGPKGRRPGRPRVANHAVLKDIWYVLWTGCQWKAVHRDWFGVSSSVLHERSGSILPPAWRNGKRCGCRIWHR